MLTGCDPDKILEFTNIMINKQRDWENPFGDGKAASRIIDIIKNFN